MGEVRKDVSNIRLTPDELFVLQSTVIAKYRKASDELNTTLNLLFRLEIPAHEIKRLAQGCATPDLVHILDHPASKPIQPSKQALIEWGAYIREKDEEANKYGNTVTRLEVLYDAYTNRPQAQGN